MCISSIFLCYLIFGLVWGDFEHDANTFIDHGNINHLDYDVICPNTDDPRIYLLSNGYISINNSVSFQANDVGAEINLMDVRLLSKNPHYYVFGKQVYAYLLDKISLKSANPHSQWNKLLNWIAGYISSMPACLDGYGDIVTEGLAGRVPGETSEWCSLSPPCSDLIQYSSYGDRCIIKVNPNHAYCIQIPKLLTASDKLPLTTDKMLAYNIQYEVQTPLLMSNWLWRSLSTAIGFSSFDEDIYRTYSVMTVVKTYWHAFRDEIESIHNSFTRNTLSVSSGMNSAAVIMGIFVNFFAEIPSLVCSVMMTSLHYVPFVDRMSALFLYGINSIPSYVAYILIGFHLFNNAEDLYSESVLLQFLLMSTCGVFLSALTFLFLMYSLVKTMLVLPKNIPFMSSIISIGILVPAAMLSNSTWFYIIKKVLLVYMIEFWNHGIFGVDWLGKLYFFVYVAGSIICTKYFKLFEDDTYSKWILIYFIKGCGISMIVYIFVCNDYYNQNQYVQCSDVSTNNIEILSIILCGIFLHDWCKYNLPSWYVTIMGLYVQTPTHVYSGRKLLSKGEYEAEGKYYTEKALKELQQSLQKDLNYANKLSDRLYKDGKYLQSNMLKRFAYGDYMGVPYDRVVHRNRDNSSYLKMLFGVLCVVCALFVYKHIFM